MNKDAKILIACEESQIVTCAFRELGFYNTFSCDILPTSGSHPEWHIKDDVLNHLDDGWDLIIAHPPCDFLANSGNTWYYHPDDKDKPASWRRPHPLYPNRHNDRKKAVEFFLKFRSVKIKCPVCIENPIPNNFLTEQAGGYHQLIRPWMFGDNENKAICLWLYGLPKLTYNKNLIGNKDQNIHKLSALNGKGSSKDRKKNRSKTFPGIAKAFADQWSPLI
jgi:hypothetical protein